MNLEKEKYIINNQVNKLHDILNIKINDIKHYIIENGMEFKSKLFDIEQKSNNVLDD